MSDMPASSSPERLIHVIQGDYAIARDDFSILTAILGSCVAACIRDPQAEIGGMNHFLLPEANASSSEQVLYGAQSMELLINALLKAGARKERLEAKIFGGARMIAGLSDIGQSNSEFARRFLRNEGIPCLAESLGGTKARRIRFWPASGRAKQMLLGSVQSIEPTPPVTRQKPTSDVELF
jgi:chemotaxis protein CheD